VKTKTRTARIEYFSGMRIKRVKSCCAPDG
jgi:hypothetical protein